MIVAAQLALLAALHRVAQHDSIDRPILFSFSSALAASQVALLAWFFSIQQAARPWSWLIVLSVCWLQALWQTAWPLAPFGWLLTGAAAASAFVCRGTRWPSSRAQPPRLGRGQFSLARLLLWATLAAVVTACFSEGWWHSGPAWLGQAVRLFTTGALLGLATVLAADSGLAWQRAVPGHKLGMIVGWLLFAVSLHIALEHLLIISGPAAIVCIVSGLATVAAARTTADLPATAGIGRR